jgi:transposase
MNLVELVKISSSEEGAEGFLREKGVLKTFNHCPFCGCQNIGKVRKNFLKCYDCRKEWSVRKDSILEELKVPFSKFILEVPVNRAYKELSLAYNTTQKIYMKIRECKFVSQDDQLLS